MHAGYYLHIEPGISFVGGGIYMPPADSLKAIRNYLASHGDEFLELINDKNFRSIYPEMYDHQLKTTPKGFPKNHPNIALLRYKSIVFSASLDNNLITSDKFIEFVINAFRILQPVNGVLNQVLENS